MYSVRTSFGGIHAPTRTICSILSYSFSTIAIIVIPNISIPTNTFTHALYIISCILLFYLGPIDTPHKRFNAHQYKRLKKRGMATIILLCTIYILLETNISKTHVYVNIILYVLIATMISCILGYMKGRERGVQS